MACDSHCLASGGSLCCRSKDMGSDLTKKKIMSDLTETSKDSRSNQILKMAFGTRKRFFFGLYVKYKFESDFIEKKLFKLIIG